MKFVLDENFPKLASSILRDLGHEVIDSRDVGFRGKEDNELFSYAVGNKGCFLTTDRDFFHTIPHTHPKHYGAIIIALKQPNRQSIIDSLSKFLASFTEQQIQGRVFQVRDRVCNIYPPLDTDPEI